jgi:hypothetical protein
MAGGNHGRRLEQKMGAGIAIGGVTIGAVAYYNRDSILGPLGVAAVGGILWVMSTYFREKNSNEMNKIKKRTFFSRIPSHSVINNILIRHS